jgi:predicted amidohydrolase YtcJ
VSGTLYRGGFVYAAGTPRATAMLVDETAGVITWIGDEGAADRLGPPDLVVDLAGALAAPAFVDACAAPGAVRRTDAVRTGTASLHVMAGLADGVLDADGPDDGGLGVETVLYWHGPAAERPPGARPATTSTDPAVVSSLVRQATDAGQQCSLWAGEDPAGVLRAVEAAEQAASPAARAVAACSHRLVADGPLPDEVVAALSRFGMVVVVTATGVGGAGGVDLRSLAAAGVPFAFGSRPLGDRQLEGPGTSAGWTDPWVAVRQASSGSPGAVSVRAAFAAATRGGRRAAGGVGSVGFVGGDLRPGAEATFGVWGFAGDLVVRTPDTRLAAWSTDPRAATPPLPDLDRGLPRWRQLVIAGRVVGVTDS